MPLVRKPASGGSSPVTPILGSLTAGSSDDRWAAARAAAEHPDGLSALAAALPQESDPRVREAMFTALARIATAASAEVTISYLKSEEASLRTGAIDALRAMPGALAPFLPALLVDSDPDVRLLSCDLVRCLPDAAANRLLCGVLDGDADKNVCASALEVLAEIGQPGAMSSVQRCAARFANDPFIAFSSKIAIDRLGALPPSVRE